MQRAIMALVAAAGVAMTTACTDSPKRVAGEAGPAGATSRSPSLYPSVAGSLPPSVAGSLSPSVAGSPSPVVTANPSAGSTTSPRPSKTSASPKKSPKPTFHPVIGPANVLGPTGLGWLQIGMTTQAAEATGMVVAGEGDSDCGSWYLKPDTKGESVVGWSSRGVVSIAAYAGIATPEGIRIGSTLDQVEKAYHDLTGVAADKDGGSWGDGPALAGQEDGYGGVHYRFLFVDGAAVKLKLEHDQPSC